MWVGELAESPPPAEGRRGGFEGTEGNWRNPLGYTAESGGTEGIGGMIPLPPSAVPLQGTEGNRRRRRERGYGGWEINI